MIAENILREKQLEALKKTVQVLWKQNQMLRAENRNLNEFLHEYMQEDSLK